MGLKAKICVVFMLFVAVVLVSATVSFGRSERDQEILGRCKLRCEQESDVLGCKKECQKEYEESEKQKREREGGQSGRGQGGRSGGHGSGDEYNIILADIEQDLPKIVEQCQRRCQGSREEKELPRCIQTCIQKQAQEYSRTRKPGDTSRQEKGKRSHEQQQSNNPYVFEDRHFTTRLESEQGNIRFLQKFTERSDLFQGIEKYRVAILEAEPQTFIIPNHWDADDLIYVINGKGTISLINQNSRENHNIKQGDLFRVPAGITEYLINRDNNEKLVLAKIFRSVSVPGELQTFLSVEGDNPAYLNAFSSEVIEAALDVNRDSLEKIFGQRKQQQKGIFKKATEEQIRTMTGKDEGGIWPFGERKGPYNIFKKDPSVANDNGNLIEVDSDDFSDLRDMNIAFSFFNITRGSMAGPLYSPKATTVLVISKGNGEFEMACPHLPEQASRSTGEFNPSYEKVASQLKQGTVVVIPAGHPIVIEASPNQDIEVIAFGLKSDKNEWFPVVGQDGVISQWEDEALELTFGAPADQVKKVLQKQKKRLFFKGPVRRGRAFA